MTLPGRRVWAIALGVLVVAVAAWQFLRGPAPPTIDGGTAETAIGRVAVDDKGREAAGIVVQAARSVTRVDRLEAAAVLALDEARTARVGSMVEGVIVATRAEVGDSVRKDAVLGEIISERVHEAWADYRKAVAERRRLTGELEFAVQSERRALRLFDSKAISSQEVQRTQANRAASEELLDMAQTEVRRAEEALEHLGITNAEDPSGESGELIPVRAPLSGIVLERLVTAGTGVTPGTPLFVVSDLSSLWALAEVDETRLSSVAAGRPADVRVSAYPGETFPAHVTFVGDIVNPKTRRVMVRCALQNPNRRLKPEMFASVMLSSGEPRSVVAVPAEAVHQMGTETVVFVETPGGFERRVVVPGPEVEGLVEIAQGLRAGERVATTGSFLLKSQLLKAATPEEG